MHSDADAYHRLSAYTLTHGDPSFLHQHVVDAQAAQGATAESKAIGVAFALAGLYLHVERGFTGREVQRAHMLLSRDRRPWPRFALPAERGGMTAADVMAAAAGADRDAAIHAWCTSVWGAYAASRNEVLAMLRERGIG